MKNSFGKRIKDARLAAGLTQQALANAMGLSAGRKLSRTTISQWELDATKNVEAQNLLFAAKVLNIRPEWLQFGTGSMRSTSMLISKEGCHNICKVRVTNNLLK